MENDDGRVRRKGTTKSRALTHFGIKIAKDKTFIEDGIAIWLYCKQTAIVHNGNISNLFSYLHTQYPAKYETVIKAEKKAKGMRKAAGTSPHSGIENSINEPFAQIKKYDKKCKQ